MKVYVAECLVMKCLNIVTFLASVLLMYSLVPRLLSRLCGEEHGYEANLCKDEFLSSDLLTLTNLPLVTMLIGHL